MAPAQLAVKWRRRRSDSKQDMIGMGLQSPVKAPKDTNRAEVCRNNVRQAPPPPEAANAAKALAKGASVSIWPCQRLLSRASASSLWYL